MLTLIEPLDLSLAAWKPSSICSRGKRWVIMWRRRASPSRARMSSAISKSAREPPRAVAERADQADLLHHQKERVELRLLHEDAEDRDGAARAARRRRRRRARTRRRRPSRPRRRPGCRSTRTSARPTAVGSNTRDAPSARAAAFCCGRRAVATISPAPPAFAAAIAVKPIVPAPSTSTRWPISSPARRSACTDTASGSVSCAVSSSTPAGIANAWRGVVTRYSAKPPGTVMPIIWFIRQRW